MVVVLLQRGDDMDLCKVYVEYSDDIPIKNNYELTRHDKKMYDLGFHDACEKINELLQDLPNETKEQIANMLDH